MNMTRPLRWGLVALIAATAVVTVVVIVAARAEVPAPVTVAPAAAAPAPDVLAGGGTRKPTVAFVGDDWTAGTTAGGEGPANLTVKLAQQHDWFVLNASQARAGYVAGTAVRPPYDQQQVPQVLRLAPQLVVVSGGRADQDVPPAQVGAAAAQVYADLKAGLPTGARIVVVGPSWQRDAATAPPPLLAVRDAIAAAAAQAGLPFVDPIAENWWGPNPQLLGVDGVHPSDAGHAYEADRYSALLAALGAMPTAPAGTAS